MLHVTDARVADEMTATALRLASERRARVVAVYTLEVPAARPLSQIAPEDEARANEQLAEAEALGQLYGVQVISRLVRTRNAGPRARGGGRAARQRGHRARLARPLGALGAPLRHDGRLRAAPRALQGDGRRHARMARRGACRRTQAGGPGVTARNRVSLILSAVLVVLGVDRSCARRRPADRASPSATSSAPRSRSPASGAAGWRCTWGGASNGAQAARAPARRRRGRALRRDLRHDLLVALLRARRRRALRARPHADRAAGRRPARRCWPPAPTPRPRRRPAAARR